MAETNGKRSIAVYVRVSTRRQDTRSQEPDLQKWIEAFGDGISVKWFKDKASGKSMDRPGWRRLEAAIDAGHVAKLVCWRLDRLGRTASGLTALFEKLCDRRVTLISIRDGLDFACVRARTLAIGQRHDRCDRHGEAHQRDERPSPRAFEAHGASDDSHPGLVGSPNG